MVRPTVPDRPRAHDLTPVPPLLPSWPFRPVPPIQLLLPIRPLPPSYLPRHRAFGELPSGFGGLLIGRADHHAFLDHVDDVGGVDGIEEENLAGLGGGEHPRARSLHLRRQRPWTVL